MGDHSDHCLLSRIDKVRVEIDENQRRIDELEKILRVTSMPDDERDNFLDELKTIRKEMNKQEVMLQSLHKQNRKSFLIVVLVALLILILILVCNSNQ